MAEINKFIEDAALEQAKQYLQIIRDTAAGYAKLSADAKSLADSIKLITKNEVDAARAQKELNTAAIQAEKLNAEKIKTEKQILDLEVKRQKEVERLAKAEEKNRKEIEKNNSEYEKLVKKQKEAIAVARDMAVKHGVNSKQAKEAAKAVKGYSDQINNINNGLGMHQNKVGNYFGALMKGALSLGAVTAGVGSIKAVFDKLKSSSQTFGDTYNTVMGGVSGVTQRFFNMLGTGNFSNFFENLSKAAKAGADYAKNLDDLFEGGLSLSVAESEARNVIAQQQLIRDNINLTKEQRIEAALEIKKQEDIIEAARITEAEKAYNTYASFAEGLTGIEREQLIDYIKTYREKEVFREQLSVKLRAIEKAENDATETYVSKSGVVITQVNKDKLKQADELKAALTDEEKQYSVLLEKYQMTNDEMVKNAIESYNKLTDINTQKNDSLRRNETKYQSFLKELDSEKLKEREKFFEELKKAEEQYMNWRNNITKEVDQLNSKILDNRKLDTFNVLSNIGKAEAEAEQKRKDALLDGNKEQLSALSERYEANKSTLLKMSEDDKNYYENRKNAEQAFKQTSIDVINTVFELGQIQRDAELDSIESKYSKQIDKAREAGQDTTQLEQELARERGRIEREQAISRRNQALFNIAITTAENVIKLFEFPPLAIAAGIAGAAQAALVLAQPLPEIPSFFNGTESAPDGIIRFGERGREIVIPENSKPFIAEKETYATGLGGARILPNSETESIIRMLGGSGSSTKAIEAKLDGIKDAIINTDKKISIVNKASNVNVIHHSRKFKRYV